MHKIIKTEKNTPISNYFLAIMHALSDSLYHTNHYFIKYEYYTKFDNHFSYFAVFDKKEKVLPHLEKISN